MSRGSSARCDEVEPVRGDGRRLPLARAHDDLDALALELVDLGHDEMLAVAERQRRGDIDDPRARMSAVGGWSHEGSRRCDLTLVAR